MSTNASNGGANVKPMSHRPHRPAIYEDLKAYADGELSALKRWQIRRHLAGCASCRQEVAGLNRVSENISNLPQPTPRPELRARIMASLPAPPPTPARLPVLSWPYHMPARLSLAVATAALLLVSLIAFARYRTAHGVPETSVDSNANSRIVSGSMAPAAATPTIPQAPTGYSEAQLNDQHSSLAVAPNPTPTRIPMTDPTSIEADRILYRERLA